VGKPKKVEDVQDGKEFSMFPVSDTAWDINASLTVKFRFFAQPWSGSVACSCLLLQLAFLALNSYRFM
jgi:hypothetical protein